MSHVSDIYMSHVSRPRHSRDTWKILLTTKVKASPSTVYSTFSSPVTLVTAGRNSEKSALPWIYIVGLLIFFFLRSSTSWGAVSRIRVPDENVQTSLSATKRLLEESWELMFERVELVFETFCVDKWDWDGVWEWVVSCGRVGVWGWDGVWDWDGVWESWVDVSEWVVSCLWRFVLLFEIVLRCEVEWWLVVEWWLEVELLFEVWVDAWVASWRLDWVAV